MNIVTNGNIIRITTASNEYSSNDVEAILPDGYSYRKILCINASNVTSIQDGLTFKAGAIYNFPVVNSSSPCTFRLHLQDVTKPSYFAIIIIKMGQKPDIHYFDTAFEPILVTGKDGEYKMIPSDQFK